MNLNFSFKYFLVNGTRLTYAAAERTIFTFHVESACYNMDGTSKILALSPLRCLCSSNYVFKPRHFSMQLPVITLVQKNVKLLDKEIFDVSSS